MVTAGTGQALSGPMACERLLSERRVKTDHSACAWWIPLAILSLIGWQRLEWSER
jgi:hypothetical protein